MTPANSGNQRVLANRAIGREVVSRGSSGTGAAGTPLLPDIRDGLLPRRAGALKCRPAMRGVESGRAEPAPIWFAALMASDCQASARGFGHAVRWDCVSGRAVYTNCGSEAETIQPLGVQLQGGHTLAVSWLPGETAYTVEVFAASGNSFRA